MFRHPLDVTPQLDLLRQKRVARPPVGLALVGKGRGIRRRQIQRRNQRPLHGVSHRFPPCSPPRASTWNCSNRPSAASISARCSLLPPGIERRPLLDQQLPRRSIRLQIRRRDDPIARQHRQREISEHPLFRRHIGLEAMVMAEERFNRARWITSGSNGDRMWTSAGPDPRRLSAGTAQSAPCPSISTGASHPRRTRSATAPPSPACRSRHGDGSRLTPGSASPGRADRRAKCASLAALGRGGQPKWRSVSS